jgi:hypothetical protein
MKPVDFRNETFDQISQRLDENRARVHRAWLALGPGTTREVAALAGIDLLTFRPRTTELYQIGLLEVIDKDGHQGVYRARTLAEWEGWCEQQRSTPNCKCFNPHQSMKSNSTQIWGIYSREVRARARKRICARAAVAAATLLLGIGFGSLVASAANPAFSTLATTILISGIAGARYLIKYH